MTPIPLNNVGIIQIVQLWLIVRASSQKKQSLIVLLIHTLLILFLEQNLGCHPHFIPMKFSDITITSTERVGMMDFVESSWHVMINLLVERSQNVQLVWSW